MTQPFRSLRPLFAAAVLGGSVLLSAAAAQPPVDHAVLADEAARVAVIQKVTPAVVAVCEAEPRRGKACGSGVLIDPEGYALTNYHVVAATGPVMTAGLPDGVLYDAVVVGTDRVGDIALIKLLPKKEGTPFPTVAVGDSSTVKFGDWSLAMGNPFGVARDFTPTVTYGLISGVNRYQPPLDAKGSIEYSDCVQIDTSINPGSSGGPLFNMKGELIGINGRGSLVADKRGRVNVGVGYALSINQVRNFLGHLYAGIETDHATLGAELGSTDEDAELPKLVVRQILDESDAARRGLQNNDQVLTFNGRVLTSSNQYKNALGILPKEWRVPLTYRRGTEKREILVRLMSQQAPEVNPDQPKGPGPAPSPKGPPAPKADTPASKLYQPKPQLGLLNAYFNNIQRDKLLAAAKKHGDFAAVAGAWVAEGTYERAQGQKGEMRLEVSGGKDDAAPVVTLKLNADNRLEPLNANAQLMLEPIGSGGLMMALYHYHRFLTHGPKGFEAEFTHGGMEPFYPPRTDGTAPKSLAELRVDCDVIRTKHGPVTCKWYFSQKDHTLLGFETYIVKNTDPCEVYLSDYKPVDGRMLPHRIEARWGDNRYAVLTVTKYTLKAN